MISRYPIVPDILSNYKSFHVSNIFHLYSAPKQGCKAFLPAQIRKTNTLLNVLLSQKLKLREDGKIKHKYFFSFWKTPPKKYLPKREGKVSLEKKTENKTNK